jgi:hypothetical protein
MSDSQLLKDSAPCNWLIIHLLVSEWVNESASHSVSQPASQPATQPFSQSVSQSVSWPTSHSVNQSASHPISQSFSQSVSQPFSQSASHSVSRPVSHSVSQLSRLHSLSILNLKFVCTVAVVCYRCMKESEAGSNTVRAEVASTCCGLGHHTIWLNVPCCMHVERSRPVVSVPQPSVSICP